MNGYNRVDHRGHDKAYVEMSGTERELFLSEVPAFVGYLIMLS